MHLLACVPCEDPIVFYRVCGRERKGGDRGGRREGKEGWRVEG